VGTVEVALAHAARLLESNPQLALQQIIEILKAAPSHPTAGLLLGTAHRLLGNTEIAADVLTVVARAQPEWPQVHYELGLVSSQLGQHDIATAELRRAVAMKPDWGDAWRALGDQLTTAGDSMGADAAYAQHIKASTRDPRLLAAASALCENQIPQAEMLLRTHLKAHPTDVAAIRMFAEVAARLRRYRDAEVLLERCLELAPGFIPARHNYAIVLHRQNKAEEALREVDALLAVDGHHPGYNNLKAAILAMIGELDGSVEIYGRVLATYPHQAKIWMSYGHALKTNGREPDSVAAYEKSIDLEPTLGEAYWSLANLKTVRFTPQQLGSMRSQLARPDLSREDRFHLHFALGKALEDAQSYAESFDHYAEGNRLRRESLNYSPQELTAYVRRCKTLFTSEFFDTRADFGSPRPDPIFIVGLPRAGSTLIEQILASHSRIEGTMELPHIPAMARSLQLPDQPGSYPQVLQNLTARQCRDLGEQYLERVRIQRKSDAPFFIDKMPNNFAHIGFIRLILPNAKIIDARRHPLGCCFSGFKQHFARGQSFTYSLEDIGLYYHDYVELMAHYDTVLPGRVHRVFYEGMIADTGTEVRRLLEFCGLPFEEQCLRFYENERAVRTASSQQVRKPIFRDGLEQHRHYEPWLAPLRQALGPVLASYPDVPAFPIRGGTINTIKGYSQ
jgi:tetratricopeptide (TPR) repeat protein